MQWAGAQNELNGSADNIVGIYSLEHKGERSKVEISRQSDGTYTVQVIWVENCLDKNGNVRLDEKNPDKSLRSVPCDKIVIIKGLRYKPEESRWSDAKIYDPVRGIRANVRCWFDENGHLKVRGSLLGLSETVTWVKDE